LDALKADCIPPVVSFTGSGTIPLFGQGQASGVHIERMLPADSAWHKWGGTLPEAQFAMFGGPGAPDGALAREKLEERQAAEISRQRKISHG
jgi:hypothetical protein